MIDLNDFVPPDSDLHLRAGATINDRGEIAVEGFRTNGYPGSALLIPCDDEPADSEGCRDAVGHVIATPIVSPTTTIQLPPHLPLSRPSAHSIGRYHGVGFGTPKN